MESTHVPQSDAAAGRVPLLRRQSAGPKRRWLRVLFALPFAAFSLFTVGAQLAPTLIDAYRARSWHEGEGVLTSAGLDVDRGDDSTTYRARATYFYEYGGRRYEGDRVAISRGSDNIGDFQQTVARRLERAYASGEPVPVWIDPDAPGEAVLNRDLRWGIVGFHFALAAMTGAFAFFLLRRALRRPAAPAPEAGDKPWLAHAEWATRKSRDARDRARGPRGLRRWDGTLWRFPSASRRCARFSGAIRVRSWAWCSRSSAWGSSHGR